MKTEAQLRESIGRFRESFWGKKAADRPPVGIACDGVWLPVNYLRKPFTKAEVQPEEVSGELAMTDYEFGFAKRPVVSDDWIPFAAAWRAIPWLEACCGCPVRYSQGSLAPGHIVDSLDALAETPIPPRNSWFDCLERETRRITASAPADCWISPSILRGNSDVVAALRGLTNFYCDLYDNLDLIDRTAARVNQLLLKAIDLHFSIVGPKLGGYGHIWGYWAPGRTIVIQEDAMGMCSPAVYRDVFRKYNAEAVAHLGECAFFHVHSTGFRHYPDVLAIPGLAGMEVTVEANGPPLLEMVPALREMLERSRLILCVDHYFEQVPEALRRLPQEGLYLIVNNRYIRTEDEFRGFIAANWG